MSKFCSHDRTLFFVVFGVLELRYPGKISPCLMLSLKMKLSRNSDLLADQRRIFRESELMKPKKSLVKLPVTRKHHPAVCKSDEMIATKQRSESRPEK